MPAKSAPALERSGVFLLGGAESFTRPFADLPILCFLRPKSRRACAAGPRPTSPLEGAIATSPADLRWEWLRHKVPITGFGAPSRGRARPCDVF